MDDASLDASSAQACEDENHEPKNNNILSGTEAILEHGGDDTPQSVHEIDDNEHTDPALDTATQQPGVKGKEKDKPYVAAHSVVPSLLPLSSKPAQFATLDTLLDKLLFIAVSGDGAVQSIYLTSSSLTLFTDPSFISSFLLTYRRFCTPRSVLLAMQKKMRQLDEPSGDPMFSCFAQMRYVPSVV